MQLGTLNWVAVGQATGLGAATKLTAVLGLAALGAFAAWSLAVQRWTPAPAAAASWRWSALATLVGLVTFVAVNPFLWPDPFGRTRSMLDQQAAIMVEQGEKFGNPVSAGLGGRVGLVAYRTFVETSTPAFDANLPPGSAPLIGPTLLGVGAGGMTLELLLALVGFGALVWRALPTWRLGARLGPATALLCWVLAYWLGIAANLSLDWPRYYVPTAFLGALLVGLAVSTFGGLGYRLLARGAAVATVVGGRRVGAAN